MSSPISSKIEADLKKAMLNAGFKKREWVNGVVVVSETEVPDQMKPLIKAQALALTATWRDWQAAQTVFVPVTAAEGTPSTGILP